MNFMVVSSHANVWNACIDSNEFPQEIFERSAKGNFTL